MDELEEMGIESLYHNQYGEAQGEESTPTFFSIGKRVSRTILITPFVREIFWTDVKLTLVQRKNGLG